MTTTKKHRARRRPWRALLSCALATALLVGATPAAPAQAMPQTIYESPVEETVIASGVRMEKIQRFTESGWVTAYVVRVDLSNPYVSLDALYNRESIVQAATVEKQAEQAGAAAAINGGYFESDPGGKSAIGTMAQGGHIDTADTALNAYYGVMGSITTDALNNVLIGYVKPYIVLRAKDRGDDVWVGLYNKDNSREDYAGVVILDRHYALNSVGASEKYPDIVELVVEGGKVRELRDAQPAVQIPVDGFVAVARKDAEGNHPFQSAAFAPGQPASFTVELTPTLEDAVMHVEGASILVSGGKIPSEFSYNPSDIAGRNPRSMVGVSQDKKELLLVAVDGRQQHSIGLNTQESAELMQSLGAWDALNLDGGGSTALAVRDIDTGSVDVANSPSEGTQRAVVNSIGVFSNAPAAALGRITIQAASTQVFVNTRVRLELSAYDRNEHPFALGANDAKWGVSGVRGRFEGGYFIPAQAGECVVAARVGKATARVSITVLPAPTELKLDQSSLSLAAGGTHTFTATARDALGRTAPVDARDIRFTVTNGVGSVKGGVFTRAGGNGGLIKATFGNAVAYCAVQPTGGGAAARTVKAPVTPWQKDAKNRVVTYTPSAGSFRMAVLGVSEAPAASESTAAAPATTTAASANGAAAATPAVDPAAGKKLAEKAFAALAGQYTDMALLVGWGAKAAGATAGAAQIPVVATDGAYGDYGDETTGGKGARLVSLSTEGGGIRAAGAWQWTNLIGILDGFSGTDLFFALPDGPAAFSNTLEAALFKRLLSEAAIEHGYRVWVLYNGARDSATLEDGVRYISCAGSSAPGTDAATGKGATYLLVTVQNGDASYAFRPLS